MKKNHKGSLMMALGLLLVAAALLLTLKNIREEASARDSTAKVLVQMRSELPAMGLESKDAPAFMPQSTPESTAPQAADAAVRATSIYISDCRGNKIAWPVDAGGNPFAWPVNRRGEPLRQLIAADGSEFAWPKDAAGEPLPWQQEAGEDSLWTVTLDGRLLPWVSDGSGRVIPWPMDASGLQMDWAMVRQFWNSLVDGMLKSFAVPPKQADFEIAQDMEMPVTQIEGNAYIGVLRLNDREMEFPIMSDWSYSKLRIAPCRYSGSAYNGSLVIAGHNYSGHFGTVRKLQPGEGLSFIDVDGNIFHYQVAAIENVERTDVQGMTGGDWDMTLFTCISGTRFRFAVRCVQTGYQLAPQ